MVPHSGCCQRRRASTPCTLPVGRSTWETPDGTAGGSDDSVTRCEILLVVNLVRDVRTEDGSEWCELTLITHAVSPVPIFFAKQLGLVAAVEGLARRAREVDGLEATTELRLDEDALDAPRDDELDDPGLALGVRARLRVVVEREPSTAERSVDGEADGGRGLLVDGPEGGVDR